MKIVSQLQTTRSTEIIYWLYRGLGEYLDRFHKFLAPKHMLSKITCSLNYNIISPTLNVYSGLGEGLDCFHLLSILNKYMFEAIFPPNFITHTLTEIDRIE